jgi:ABC transporter
MRRLPDIVGLADRARAPIARFSKGMKERLALAQAVLSEPDLLVLDEPMEGLDLRARLVLHDILREQRRCGKTVLVVSHALGGNRPGVRPARRAGRGTPRAAISWSPLAQVTGLTRLTATVKWASLVDAPFQIAPYLPAW